MIPDLLVSVLSDTFAGHIDGKMRSYASSQRTDRWLMFSDYVLGQAGRPNDTFAFTIMPGGQHLEGLNFDIRRIANRDLKETKNVSEPMMRLLVDRRLMTFCFLLPRNRPRDLKSLRQAIENSLDMMKSWQNHDACLPMIKRVEALRRKAQSQSFSVRLLDDIILATTFAAFLTTQICRHARVERFGWFSDVDKITTAHQGIAADLYSSNVSAFCQRLLGGWKGPKLGIAAQLSSGERLWCDPHLRIPDHFAGVVSAWNLTANEIPASSPKYLPVLAQAVADQENVHLIKVEPKTTREDLIIQASRVVVSRSPVT